MVEPRDINWNIIDGQWVEEINCVGDAGKIERKFTLLGVVTHNAPIIFRYLGAKSSYDTYLHLLNSTILPNIDRHNDLTIDEYSQEILEDCILNIKKRGRIRNKGFYEPYDNATINRCKMILRNIVQTAYDIGLVKSDILWGSSFGLDNTEIDSAKKDYEELIRKFAVEDDLRIQRELMASPEVKGQYLCLLLCDILGLRINEACAVNWSDIREIEGHPGAYVLWVYETTSLDSNALKPSGKTENADRVIPIPDGLVSFLTKRRAWIEEKIGYPVGGCDIPIGCYESDYLRRCYTPQISVAAKEVFIKCNINPKILACLDFELKQDENWVTVREKEATAYCFRRNSVTIFSFLGLTDAEISYLIGHQITEGTLTRNEYTNPDMLYRLWEKIHGRHVCGEDAPWMTELYVEESGQLTYSGAGPVCLKIPDGAGRVTLRVAAMEQGDPLRVSFPDGTPPGFMIATQDIPRSMEQVNVLKQYKKLYGSVY